MTENKRADDNATNTLNDDVKFVCTTDCYTGGATDLYILDQLRYELVICKMIM